MIDINQLISLVKGNNSEEIIRLLESKKGIDELITNEDVKILLEEAAPHVQLQLTRFLLNKYFTTQNHSKGKNNREIIFFLQQYLIRYTSYFTNPLKIVESSNRGNEIQERLLELGRKASEFKASELNDSPLDKAVLEKHIKMLKRVKRMSQQGLTEQRFKHLFSDKARMAKLLGNPKAIHFGGILKKLMEQYYTLLHYRYPYKQKILKQDDGNFLIHDTLRMAGWLRQVLPVEEREFLFEYMKIAEDQLSKEGFTNGKAPSPPIKARIPSHCLWKTLSDSLDINPEDCVKHVFKQFYLGYWEEKDRRDQATALLKWDTNALKKIGEQPFLGSHGPDLWVQLQSDLGNNIWDQLKRDEPLRRTSGKLPKISTVSRAQRVYKRKIRNKRRKRIQYEAGHVWHSCFDKGKMQKNGFILYPDPNNNNQAKLAIMDNNNPIQFTLKFDFGENHNLWIGLQHDDTSGKVARYPSIKETVRAAVNGCLDVFEEKALEDHTLSAAESRRFSPKLLNFLAYGVVQMNHIDTAANLRSASSHSFFKKTSLSQTASITISEQAYHKETTLARIFPSQ